MSAKCLVSVGIGFEESLECDLLAEHGELHHDRGHGVFWRLDPDDERWALSEGDDE